MTDLLLGLEREESRKPSERVEQLAPSPEDEAMDEFFDAHERGDRKAAREAFRSAVRICVMQGSENSTDEEGT